MNIIQFPAAAHRPRFSPITNGATAALLIGAGGVSTDIPLNKQLREDRREIWDAADAKTEYLYAQFKMRWALIVAQKYNLPEVAGLTLATDDERSALLELYRRALVQQILTPAPTAAKVIWKRRTVERFASCDYCGVEPKIIDRAIFTDEAFLRAHPVRFPRETRKAKSPQA